MLQQQTKKKNQKQNMVVFRDYRKQAVKLVNSQKEKKKQQKQQDYLHKYVFDYLCSNGHV